MIFRGWLMIGTMVLGLLALVAACGARPASSAASGAAAAGAATSPASPVASPVVAADTESPPTELVPPPDEAVPPPEGEGPGGADTPAEPVVLPAADGWPGKRARRRTAVLLFSPPLGEDAADRERVFQPLVCAVAGRRATGARCGEAMPPRATIRTPAGELVVTRSTAPFHDEAGQHDYPAPYGPACCMYNTCVGRTVPYTASRGAVAAASPGTILAVWPADADIALEVATAGAVGGAGDSVPLTSAGQSVDQAFARGAWRYASVRERGGGAVLWNAGAGWVTAARTIGPRGYTLLATSDVDRDGHLELISYQRWANDYGLDVFGDKDPKPIYSFSCGNI